MTTTTTTTKSNSKLDTLVLSSFGGQQQIQQQQRDIRSNLIDFTTKETTNTLKDCTHPKRMVMRWLQLLLLLPFLFPSNPVYAVSGGGLDYANLDITGQNFSNGNYKGKDFTQVIAKGTNFQNSNLQGCRFYKAFLVRFEVYVHILCMFFFWIPQSFFFSLFLCLSLFSL